ncbi:hypothetical protein ARMSODRAFT_896187 [Armillaria solidipes]|uniref:Integrase zinc-binding domain-containing protein n=1 Tax=Armillaria solidipes TaxID=1076256 RepID=A0A2H3BG00_9AGAR|nr:hypothetical protein ARMSODRAFT_896187 [Armillaria solidipes]
MPSFDSIKAEKRFLKRASQFYMTTDQRMFQRNADKIPRLVILNPETRQRVLEEAHDRLGHKGEQAVYDVLRLRVFWPYLRTHVHQHVASCHECQRRKMM